MRNKLLAILLCLPMLFIGICTAHAESADVTYTVAQVRSLCDGIVAYSGAQSFIDGYLRSNAGTTAEFYAIAVSQSGDYDFSSYEDALLSYLDTHEVYSATSREKYALALAAAGSTDSYISDTADEAIGELGVMSLVFGLHLLNNGYDSDLYSADGLVSELLSWRKSDGGWAVMGSYSDTDVTAMTLQALAPYYGVRSDVTAAVNEALDKLSSMQLDSGGFKTMGAENCESAAQVIIALSALGIDPQYDSRFIKNGNSAFMGMMQYHLSSGSFAHTGASANDTATMEAYCALVAYQRMRYSQGSLYQLDHVNHSAPAPVTKGNNSDNSGNAGHPSAPSRSNTGNGGNTSNDTNNTSNPSRPDGVQTDSNGNRIVIINGQRYIEATTASGEMVTVNVSETEAPVSNETTQHAPTYGGFQPAATADMRVAASTADGGGKASYKPYVILGIVLSASAACAVLYLLKKRNKKNYIAVAVIAAAGVLFILLTDFQSPDSHRESSVTDGDLTVTLSIRCDTIADRKKVNDFIPDDGVILDTTTCHASQGDTVYDVLQAALSERDIPMDNRGANGSAYIAGINGLYEFDYGDLSGWMYRVNGDFPEVGCQSYYVQDGDTIEWLYTTEIGKDLE